MHPLLFKLGPLELHSYGFMLALSFFFGIMLASKRAPVRGVASELVFDTAIVIVFASIFGARLLYVLFHLSEMENVLDVIAVWKGGLSMYGGVLLGLAAIYSYTKRRGVPFLRMTDIMAPSLGMGLMLTRVGCFLNGCCYGKPTESFLGVHFPEGSFLDRMYETALHPTQLYSSFTGLAIVLILLAWDRKNRPEGQVFAIFLILDSVGRFVLDYFRQYESSVYMFGGLTITQIICACLLVAGVSILIWGRKMPSAKEGAWRDESTAASAAG